MIGRFSILKYMDLEKINKNIKIYEDSTGKEPYLFMSNETANAVCKQATSYLGTLFPYKPNDVLTLYDGYKVFPNNDLEFGEVEIR